MNGNMGAPGDGVRMSGDRVAGVAAEVTGRAVAGEGSWAAGPGFRPVAAGAAFLDRGARLEAAVEAMLGRGRREHDGLSDYEPAVAAQFAALDGVDASSGSAVGRIGVPGGERA